ncbi:hypothetical protein [Nitrosopumilus sp.]|uniref:hypothetical protein n=1 Tax=Nitrosopumilus sp. TaxID=2024843 RepID=UPI00292E59FB|nr:hypothetical protein [Nitrosopumilus sp.]
MAVFNSDVIAYFSILRPINYKIFLLIFGILIVFQTYAVSLVENDKTTELDTVVFTISFLSPAIAFSAAFFVYRRYRDSRVFGRSYLALFLAFLMIFLGEVTYFVYEDVLKVDPYPSIADVFFFAFYLLVLYHIRMNIKSFYSKLSKRKTIGVVGALSVIVIVIYVILLLLNVSGSDEDINNIVGNNIFSSYGYMNILFSFDVLYGIAFVAASAATFWYSVIGIVAFRRGALETVWIILVAGISLLTLGDAIYFHTEVLGEYTFDHYVNLLWYAGYMVIVYALYKHAKAV